MSDEQKPSLGERFAQGAKRFVSEIGTELNRMGTLGATEAGAFFGQAFPPGENVYRGDYANAQADPAQTAGGLSALQDATPYQPRIQPPDASERQSQSL